MLDGSLVALSPDLTLDRLLHPMQHAREPVLDDSVLKDILAAMGSAPHRSLRDLGVFKTPSASGASAASSSGFGPTTSLAFGASSASSSGFGSTTSLAFGASSASSSGFGPTTSLAFGASSASSAGFQHFSLPTHQQASSSMTYNRAPPQAMQQQGFSHLASAPMKNLFAFSGANALAPSPGFNAANAHPPPHSGRPAMGGAPLPGAFGLGGGTTQLQNLQYSSFNTADNGRVQARGDDEDDE
jgi:hypothetical protein